MKCALSKTRMKYMEIKGQLDATDGFLLQNLLFAQHVSGHHYAHHQELKSIIQVVAACGTWCLVYRPTRCNRWFFIAKLIVISGTIMPIIRSSRVLYRWLLPVVLGAWFIGQLDATDGS